MKKITMVVAFVFAFVTQGYAQFPEGFEGATFPPTGWTQYPGTNGFGAAEEWIQLGDLPATGDFSAAIPWDDTDPGEAKEDWLVTPQFTPTAGAAALQFSMAQAYTDEYLSTYSIRVSTTSQTDIASFTTVASYTESDMLPAQVYVQKLVDLTAYVGTPIYVAFVMTNDNGDFWLIDDVDMVSLVDAPNCATAPITPADAATGVAVGTVDFSWTAPATGDAPTSYDMYYGLDAGDVNNLVGNFTDTTVPILLGDYDTTFYWRIVAKNAAGEATGCAVWSFTTQSPPGYCLAGDLYPADAYTPDTCDGVTVNEIVDDAYAGEFSLVNLTSGQTYTFSSSVATDFITISDVDGTTSLVAGTTPVTYVAPADVTVRFYTHLDDQCGTEAENRVRGVKCGTPTAEFPDYVGLQAPASETISQGGTVTVYGQVYEPGVTEPAGQGAGITAWVGVNAADTNPNSWAEASWVPADYNDLCGGCGNNDEYMAAVGADLDPGTYYYAVRFRLGSGAYAYGGTNGTSGNTWDGVTFNNGVLTVTPPPAPNNDECGGAIALTPYADFASSAIVTTNFGATGTDTASCQASSGENVWYSVQVPASGSITIETGESFGSLMTDTVIAVFSGSCGTLTEIACDDDIDAAGGNLYSMLELTGRTPGETLFISVWRYTGLFTDGDWGDFLIAAYDASLANPTFTSDNFRAYPNPVKNVLNLSSVENITNVAVYNLLGQQVLAKAMNAAEGQVDMSALSQGTYMVKVTANNQVKTIKVIKE